MLVAGGMTRNHERLEAFQLADHLAVLVYRATAEFPREERFGLTSQLRRASVSVATNIVEGCARQTQREYAYFLNIASGSAAEVRYLLNLSSRLNLADQEKLADCENCALRAVQVLHTLQRAVAALP